MTCAPAASTCDKGRNCPLPFLDPTLRQLDRTPQAGVSRPTTRTTHWHFQQRRHPLKPAKQVHTQTLALNCSLSERNVFCFTQKTVCLQTCPSTAVPWTLMSEIQVVPPVQLGAGALKVHLRFIMVTANGWLKWRSVLTQKCWAWLQSLTTRYRASLPEKSRNNTIFRQIQVGGD